jgi:tRNA-specific 2-thiouridylase
VKLDPARRQVVVGPKEALETHRLTLRDINWLGDVPLKELPEEGLPVLAKVRSTRPPVAARLRPAQDGAEVDLLQGEDGVAPGQACVFYEAGSGERVLGGGWIARAESRWQHVGAGLAGRAGAAE